MSSSTGKARPLLNLGEFVREEISSSPPVSVPKKTHKSKQVGFSAPSAARHAVRAGDSESSDNLPYSASLIAPVMDETEVLLSTSASSQSSSVVMRHKEAAVLTYGTGSNGAVPRDGGERGYLTKSINIEEEYVKIQARNEAKRQDHATT